jgi:sugar phosphate isomerase/epimerase
MRLKVFKTLWGHSGTIGQAVADCVDAGFSGLEGLPPTGPGARREMRQRLDDAGLDYVAEVCTAGGYVPLRNATVADHLESLRVGIGRAQECRALFVTAVAGCDAWSVAQSVAFFGSGNALASETGIPISFETHRSRSLFHPWITGDVLAQLPDLLLTCDFSHWCVVCERLLDTEPEILKLCADRALHIHARVGYDQGPQVPDPAAPEYRVDLEAHERWWTMVWEARERRGEALATMTPEFGPDGYQHEIPFSRTPIADLWTINRWIGDRQKERFAQWAEPPNFVEAA